ncbi:MAG: Cd(II)/Pb(II)-responsive transcriptional regulator [Rhodocyclaceae bacterium]|nr:Cd(II)/Pb(II)-responsive transcriptional regulator [Rhodocyclaceae bacterium]
MRIGELATATDSEVDTIRYYEKIGILPKPQRTDSNYRHYGDQHVERLRFVRRCRSLDMTLDEIRVLLQFRDAPEANCGEVNVLLDEHIGHVTARIAALTKLEKELRSLRRQCRSVQRAKDCGILVKIASSNSPPTSNKQRMSKPHISGTHR